MIVQKIFKDLNEPSITRFLSPISKGKYPIYYNFADNTPKRNTYIIYLIYDEKHDLYSDDLAISDKFSIQVDVFSLKSPDDVAKAVEKHFEKLDYRLTTRYRNYEKDTNLYHIVLRFDISILKVEDF